MIKIYKGLMPEDERLKALSIIEDMPDRFWSQSIASKHKVEQLGDYLPMYVYGTLNQVHQDMHQVIEREFDYELLPPNFSRGEIFSVDRRTTGYSLPMHKDFPDEEFMHLLETPNGSNTIEITAVFYWNKDFTGGELYFEEDDFLYKPEAGDLIVFNSKLQHEVREITSGSRYSTQRFFVSQAQTKFK